MFHRISTTESVIGDASESTAELINHVASNTPAVRIVLRGVADEAGALFSRIVALKKIRAGNR